MGGDILEIMNDIHLSIIMAYLHWEGRQHSDDVFSHQCKCMWEYADEIDVFMNLATNILVYLDVASCGIMKPVVYSDDVFMNATTNMFLHAW